MRPGRFGPLRVFVAALLVWGAVPAHAQLFSDDEARRAVLDLRGRVEQMQRDVNRRLEEMSARIDRLEQTTRGQLELQNQIQAMRQEIATLRGQVEVQGNELAQTQKRQKDLATDVDTRIKRFEPVAVTIDGKAFNVDVNERRAFEAALNLFRNGDFRGSIVAFQQFQAAYPQSPYVPGSVYWIGSAQYALKEPKPAIATLQSFVAKNADHPRTPDALLTIGNAYADLGDRKAATDTYRTLVEKYDGTAAAQAARERMTTPAPRR